MTAGFGPPFRGLWSSDARRGWRVGHQGRDRMFYEELHDGVWERIDIDGEMLTGRAHHVIYFASPEQWRTYPPWARDRRDEIVSRITSEFRAPDYEYWGLDGEPDASPPPVEPGAKASAGPVAVIVKHGRPPSPGSGTLLLTVVLLFAIAAAMGALVASGVATGETHLPLERAFLRRTVTRAAEPVTYWLSIAIYASIGAGMLWLAALGARAWRRL